MYQVVINARNEKGDTTYLTRYVSLLGDHSKSVKFDNWVIPVLNYVKPGDTASFLVGIDQKITVLMERYKASKLISSNWLTIDTGQQNIKIPVADADNDVAVQFMMVSQNRIYVSYQKIYLSNTDKQLKIKFTTFRNKLQPGEKEQWKLRISNDNNEKQAAEMVAGLYDASLDDITPPQNWQEALNRGDRELPNFFAWNSLGFYAAHKHVPGHL